MKINAPYGRTAAQRHTGIPSRPLGVRKARKQIKPNIVILVEKVTQIRAIKMRGDTSDVRIHNDYTGGEI